MKREESSCAIKCDHENGLMIGINDIYIGDNCNEENSCHIGNDGTYGYECHPKYKCSLFVNTARSDERNRFSVLDYEVFTHN